MSEQLKAPELDPGTVDDLINRAVDTERERCALLCEQLAAQHQRAADKMRTKGTYTTRAIWPPLKKMSFVAPSFERCAKDIEAAVRSLRVIAGCIRLRYDPLNMLKPEDVARIKDYVSPIKALNPPPLPAVDIDDVYMKHDGKWVPKKDRGHLLNGVWTPCSKCSDPMDCGSWQTCFRSNRYA